MVGQCRAHCPGMKLLWIDDSELSFLRLTERRVVFFEVDWWSRIRTPTTLQGLATCAESSKALSPLLLAP